VTLTIIISLAGALIIMYSSKFLEDWSKDFNEDNKYMKLKEYSVISLVGTLMLSFITVITGIIGYFLSIKMHSMMVFSTLHSQIEHFLDRVPVGRLLNRFSGDIYDIDCKVYYVFSYTLRTNSRALILLATFCYVVGWEVLLLILLWFVLAVHTQLQISDIRRDFKRLQSITKTPMINTLSDTLKGLTNLRNSSMEIFSWTKSKFMDSVKLLANLKIYDSLILSWFDVRIGFGQIMILQGGTFLLLAFYYENLTIDKFGLFLLCLFQLEGILNVCMKVRTEITVAMVAIERCSFIKNPSPEANMFSLQKERKMFSSGGKTAMRKLLRYE